MRTAGLLLTDRNSICPKLVSLVKDFVGTDCHCIEHLVVLEENIDLPYLRKVGQLLLKNTVL